MCPENGCLDWVFCVDTTNSMAANIESVKADAVDMTNQLFGSGADVRIAAVDYRYFPSISGDSNDYPYLHNTNEGGGGGFITDINSIDILLCTTLNLHLLDRRQQQ